MLTPDKQPCGTMSAVQVLIDNLYILMFAVVTNYGGLPIIVHINSCNSTSKIASNLVYTKTNVIDSSIQHLAQHMVYHTERGSKDERWACKWRAVENQRYIQVQVHAAHTTYEYKHTQCNHSVTDTLGTEKQFAIQRVRLFRGYFTRIANYMDPQSSLLI